MTLWFWVIKILCTTVGESLADYINVNLGLGLSGTAVLFTVVLAASLVWQFRQPRYVPSVYWLTVVVVSVTGTLYTDILTDQWAVPLWLSSTVFGVLLAIVFAIWFSREQTLSIHTINTVPREAFYWLTVLVTFALGTATGDGILELTGWTPGQSVLFPAALIAVVAIGWRQGANPVLAFWLAYILTRPLGANLGDFFGFDTIDGGLGVGTLGTSLIFLAAIAVTVLYLTRSRVDVTTAGRTTATRTSSASTQRQVLIGWLVAAAVAAAVLGYASQHKGSATLAEGPSAAPTLAPGQAVVPFTAADLASFRTVTTSTLDLIAQGQQDQAVTRVKDLETGWDDSQAALQAKDPERWTTLDGKIDDVLTSVRAKQPDAGAEKAALDALSAGLRG